MSTTLHTMEGCIDIRNAAPPVASQAYHMMHPATGHVTTGHMQQNPFKILKQPEHSIDTFHNQNYDFLQSQISGNSLQHATQGYDIDSDISSVPSQRQNVTAVAIQRVQGTHSEQVPDGVANMQNTSGMPVEKSVTDEGSMAQFENVEVSAENDRSDETEDNDIMNNSEYNEHDTSTEPPTETEVFKCTVCNRIYKTKKELQKHSYRHLQEKKHKCPECPKSYRSASELVLHKRSHSDEKPFCCDVCGKGFVTASTMKIHMRTHTGEKPYKCEFCELSFTQAGNLKIHRRQHTGETPYECKECGKSFSQLGNLTQHMTRHTGVYPYICSICGQGCLGKTHFMRHMRGHSGEKPHKCQLCGKGFTTNAGLVVHNLTHTGEKPFQCTNCGATFRRKTHLQRHVSAVHQGRRPHQCDVCEKSFTQHGHLVQHKRVHTGEHPYKCGYCGRAFTQSTPLKKHKQCHDNDPLYMLWLEQSKLEKEIQESNAKNDTQVAPKLTADMVENVEGGLPDVYKNMSNIWAQQIEKVETTAVCDDESSEQNTKDIQLSNLYYQFSEVLHEVKKKTEEPLQPPPPLILEDSDVENHDQIDESAKDQSADSTDIGQNDKSGVTALEIDQEVQVVKKKRGRPKKIKEVDENTPKKKRGRPKKVKVDEPEEEANEDTEECTDNPVKLKKRGRPKKVKVVESGEEALEDTEEGPKNSVEPKKKKVPTATLR